MVIIVFYGYISIVLWQQSFMPRNFNFIILFNESSVTIVPLYRNNFKIIEYIMAHLSSNSFRPSLKISVDDCWWSRRTDYRESVESDG